MTESGSGLSADGLHRFDTRRLAYDHHFLHNPLNRQSLIRNRVNSLLDDDRGMLWIGTSGGLNIYEPDSGTMYRLESHPFDATDQGLDNIWALFSDDVGNVWVGTYYGGIKVSLKYRNPFRNYTNVPGRESKARSFKWLRRATVAGRGFERRRRLE